MVCRNINTKDLITVMSKSTKVVIRIPFRFNINNWIDSLFRHLNSEYKQNSTTENAMNYILIIRNIFLDTNYNCVLKKGCY